MIEVLQNLQNVTKIPELKRRLLVTAGLLAAYRLGGTEFLHSDKGVPVSRDQARLPRGTVQITHERAEPFLFGPARGQHQHDAKSDLHHREQWRVVEAPHLAMR